MKGELVTTITKDGIELQGFWMDQKSGLAIFHSHGTAGDFYTHEFIKTEGQELAKREISFLTANNRGHDVYADLHKIEKGKMGWVQIGGGFEKFEDCILDIEAWVEFLTKRGVKKIVLQGHSLSQKILYYQAEKHNPKVIGQIHLSPQNDAGIMYYSLGEGEYKKTNKMIEKMVKDGKGGELLPKELSPVSYATSALMYSGYLTEDGAGTLTPYHNPNSKNWQVLAKTTDPLLIVYGSEDVYMKPSVEVATKLMREKARAAKSIEVQVIKGATHSYVGYENELVKVIIDWSNKISDLSR